jgi:single-strand DNA-binding protein
MNKLIVIGNLGRAPEVRYTPDGQMVASFSVASNHVYKDKLGLKHTETEWFNCLAYGKFVNFRPMMYHRFSANMYHLLSP